MSQDNDPRIAMLGNSSIGIFGLSTDTFAIIPSNTKDTVYTTAKDILKVPTIQSTVASSSLVGLFSVANSHHLLLPEFISEHEYEYLSKELPDDVSLHLLESKLTALGNAIVTSDEKALVHSDFTYAEKKTIADTLDVEVITNSFDQGGLIGSNIFMTNNGLLTNPLFKQSEIEWLSDIFGVNGDVVTVNRGSPYPRLGIIANSNGVLVGSDTTGPEIVRIFEVLL